jgi:hypothetical protein
MAKRTKEETMSFLARAKGFKPSEWKSWPIVKQADEETGEIRRDKAGRHWESAGGDLRYKKRATQVPNPTQGAPSTQPYKGLEEEED